MRPVAALYVDTARGPYVGLPGVDCWGFATRDGRQRDLFARTRDARAYAGPAPIVAHPPCGPWGRFWWNYKGGEGDRECGPTAIKQAREWGGVVEHPSESGLWAHLGLPKPGEAPDASGGWTLEVQQCDWGHKARKRTWLYIVGARRADLPPMPPPREPTHVMVRLLRNGNDWPEVPKRERHLTPPDFARWLVEVARRCDSPRYQEARAWDLAGDMLIDHDPDDDDPDAWGLARERLALRLLADMRK